MILRYATIASFLLPFLAASQTQNYPIGSLVSNFTVTDTDGENYDLYELTAAGKVVVLDFFFYNCVPCQDNAPSFSQLYDTYGCNGGDLICISVNNGTDTDELAEQFGEDFGGAFSHPPTVGPIDGLEMTSIFGVDAFPTFCIIGTDNRMEDDDIWPLSNGMATLVAAFPIGSQIQPMACTVGMGEQDRVVNASVFPTPSNGMISLVLDLKQAGPLTATVVDALGKQVVTFPLGTLNTGTTKRDLDLTTLADGHYLLRLQLGANAAIQQRIVITH